MKRLIALILLLSAVSAYALDYKKLADLMIVNRFLDFILDDDYQGAALFLASSARVMSPNQFEYLLKIVPLFISVDPHLTRPQKEREIDRFFDTIREKVPEDILRTIPELQK
jgi:hypothetical protein